MFDMAYWFRLLKGNQNEQAICITIVIVLSTCPAIDLTQFRVPYATASIKGLTFDMGFGVNWEGNEEPKIRYGSFSINPVHFWRTKTNSDTVDFSAGITSSMEWFYWLWDNYEPTSRKINNRLFLWSNPSISWNRYLKSSDFFLGTKISGLVSIDGYIEQNGSIRSAKWRVSGDGSSQFGFGYGRVRDAGSLLKAIDITDILDEEGMLKRKLSDEELLGLANFISRSWKLFYIHERATKFYYDSLDNYLLNTGATSGRLPAYVLFRIDEGLALGSYTRQFGKKIFIGAYISGSGDFSLERYQGDNQVYKYFDGRKDINPLFEFEYAKPFGLRWTTTVVGQYRFSFPEKALNHYLDLEIGAGYQVIDRLSLSADFRLSPKYLQSFAADGSNTLDLNVNATLKANYYLENQSSIETGLNWHCFAPSLAEAGFEQKDFRLALYLSLSIRPLNF